MACRRIALAMAIYNFDGVNNQDKGYQQMCGLFNDVGRSEVLLVV